MGEIIVSLVVSKLADFILKDLQGLWGFKPRLEKMQRELIQIQCCIKDAESKCKTNNKVINWLKELHDVSYCIEDAIDTFFSLRGTDCGREKNFREKFLQRSSWQEPLNIAVRRYNLVKELDKIEMLLREVCERRSRYGIEELEGTHSEEAVRLTSRRAIYHQMDENEVVGLETDKNNILKLLCRENTPRRAVITIVGTGGIGKTTLAQMVYKSARADFEYHVMLSVSQNFSVMDLLKKMIKKFNVNYSSPEQQNENDVGEHVKELTRYLSSRRYLIVLDDVWGIDLWKELQHALPDHKNGSRILMTSRNSKVAKFADPTIKPYEIKFLNDEDSQLLLLKKAIPHQETHEKCPTNLSDIAYELSKKCKGLPLALIVLGGILSTKDQSYAQWKSMLLTMNWHSDGTECMNVLAMSYQDMSHYLKTCFLYLSVFPEDCDISAKRLISMWIAEGFIPPEETRTMEETAQNFLEDLFQRSMIQVSSRHTNGSIKYCRVHDLIRDLAVHKAEEENFVTVFIQKPSAYLQQKNGENRRRISLQSCILDCTKAINPNIRSILSFRSCTPVPKFINFKLLRVLEIVGAGSKTELTGLEVLNNLKYLGFIDCEFLKSNKFTNSIRNLGNLETLFIPETDINPDGIWAGSKLRHVRCKSVPGPPPTAHLEYLQTLKWADVPNSWLPTLPLLYSLRKLGLRNTLQNWDSVTDLLKTLPDLVSLGLDGSSIPLKVFYPTVLQNYNNLQSLYLKGECSTDVTIVGRLFPPNLVKLTLIGSNFQKDPMPQLGKLQSLKKLCLRKAYCGDQMICPAGFPVLQNLKVQDGRCKEFKVAKGVMPKLVYLEVSDRCNLQMPRDLLLVVTITDILKDYY